jgi:hypothetical protein
MKKFWFYVGFITFALVTPLIVLNHHFPFVTFIERSAEYQLSVIGVIGLLIILTFFRKQIVKWAKSFEQVTVFKGIAIWLVYIFPTLFAFLIIFFATKYAETLVPVFGYTLISNMIAGVFLAFYESERAEDYRKWLKK